MSKKLKPKRNKKYQPADASPTIRRYSAETEAKAAKVKLWRRRTVGYGLLLALLLLLGWWVA